MKNSSRSFEIDGKKYTVRWRKTTATYVVYLKGKVFESGYDSEEEAIRETRDYIERLKQPKVRLKLR